MKPPLSFQQQLRGNHIFIAQTQPIFNFIEHLMLSFCILSKRSAPRPVFPPTQKAKTQRRATSIPRPARAFKGLPRLDCGFKKYMA
jgi:hypothetical protein